MDTAATPASPEVPQAVACRVWDLTSAKLTIKVVLKTYARGADGTMGALSGSRRATRGGLFLDIFPIGFVIARSQRAVEASSKVVPNSTRYSAITFWLGHYAQQSFSWQRYA